MSGAFIRYRDNCSEPNGGMRVLLLISSGKVTSQRLIEGGLYVLPDMRGWTIAQLAQWTHEVGHVGTQHNARHTGSAPILQLHELRVAPGEWDNCWSVERLEAALRFGSESITAQKL